MTRALALVFALLLLPGCKRILGGGDAGGGLISALASLVGFEGEIDMAVDLGTPGGIASTMTMSMKIKGDKMRMETAMPGLSSALLGAVIVDGTAQKSYTLMPVTKEYMEVDIKGTGSAPAAVKPVITHPGRTDKIAGYGCEIISMTEPGKRERTEVCSSKGLTFLALGMGPLSALGNASGVGELLKEGFPLRMEAFDATGARLMKMEATRIEKKSLPASDFEIPAGYKKLVSSVPATTLGGP